MKNNFIAVATTNYHYESRRPLRSGVSKIIADYLPIDLSGSDLKEYPSPGLFLLSADSCKTKLVRQSASTEITVIYGKPVIFLNHNAVYPSNKKY